MKRRWLGALALIGLVVGAHLPSLRARFAWDDAALILRDPLIRSWRLIPEGFQHFLFIDATPSNFFRPLQRLSYTLDYWAFAFRPAAYHLTSLLVHAAAAIALFVFALEFLRATVLTERAQTTTAFLASAIWAVHPLHSAAVDYIAGRADPLAAVFGFLALWCALRATREEGRAGWKYQALGGVLILASALSKESGLLFAALWIALVFRPGRLRALAPAGVVIAFALMIYFTMRTQVPPVEVPQLSPPAPLLIRPIIAARALAEYAQLLVLPLNLHMERDVESHPWGYNDESLTATSWQELGTVAGVVVEVALLIWLVRSRKRPTFRLLLCAVISYLPVSGGFALNANMAEHWVYVPSAFLILAAAFDLFAVSENRARLQRCLVVAAVMLIAAYGARSFFRARDWHDSRTFFERTIAQGGNSVRMLINLGTVESGEGHQDRAKKLFEGALARQPDQPFALLGMATVALRTNDFATCRELLKRARENSASAAAANEMTAVLDHKEFGKTDLLRLRLASRSEGATWLIEKRYVEVLDASGFTARAVEELRGLTNTEWYRADTWLLYSEILHKLGRDGEAAQALARAHQLDVHLPAKA